MEKFDKMASFWYFWINRNIIIGIYTRNLSKAMQQSLQIGYAQFAGTTEYMLPSRTAMYAQFAGPVNKQQRFSECSECSDQ